MMKKYCLYFSALLFITVQSIQSSAKAGLTNDPETIEIERRSYGIYFSETIQIGADLCKYLKKNGDYEIFKIKGEKIQIDTRYRGWSYPEGDLKTDQCILNHSYLCNQLLVENDGLHCDTKVIDFDGIDRNQKDPIEVCGLMNATYGNKAQNSEIETIKYGSCSFDVFYRKESLNTFNLKCFLKSSDSIDVPEELENEIGKVQTVEKSYNDIEENTPDDEGYVEGMPGYHDVQKSYDYTSNGCTKLYLSRNEVVCEYGNNQVATFLWKEKCEGNIPFKN